MDEQDRAIAERYDELLKSGTDDETAKRIVGDEFNITNSWYVDDVYDEWLNEKFA